jgi:hypothetical protein
MTIWDAESRFYSASSRLARGYEHIGELERQVRKFLFETRHDIVREPDPDDARYQLLRFRFSERLPDSATHLATEALEALRSALDQAAYAAAIVSGRIAPRWTQFPISDSATELENLITGRRVCRDLPDEIVTLFRSFQPYKGADNPLWALNKLRNSTHTTLIPVQAAAISVWVRPHPHSGDIETFDPFYDRGKNEIVFGRAFLTDHLSYNVRPTFLVCFDEAVVTGGEYAVGFLHRAAVKVEDILLATEAECRRLGFIP